MSHRDRLNKYSDSDFTDLVNGQLEYLEVLGKSDEELANHVKIWKDAYYNQTLTREQLEQIY